MFNPFDLKKIAKDFKRASENLDREQLRTEIFNAFLQGFQGKEMPEALRGKDLYYNLSLCFNDAMLGSKQEIRINRLEATANGELNTVTRILKFTIPKGQGHESTLKLKEQGDASQHGGKPGDLFVVLVIPEDDKDRKHNELNNDIFTNIKVASDNFDRDLSKMLLLSTEIQKVEQGDTFGEDLRLDLSIEFNDAMRGCNREIKIPRLEMTKQRKLEQVVKSLKVNIPAGTTHGKKLRLRGQGDACRHGGKPGDLYLYLLVASPAKERTSNDVNIGSAVKVPKSDSRGEDLHIDLALGFNDARLGCVKDVEISRLELNAKGELGRVTSSLKFTIPADTSHGDKLRLKGQGDACSDGGEAGDLYLYLMVRSPEKARYSEAESKRNDVSVESEIETNGLHFKDKDLRFDLAIGFDEAILGCERELQIPRTEMTEEGELECVLKSLKVTIPAGTNHGSTLRLKGQGNACRYGGEAGDLYLYLFVALQDKERKRNGINIEAEVTITSSQASAGGEIVVNTTTGWRTIFVSPGTKTGDSLILSGCGVCQSGKSSKNGDYIIKFKCE